MHRIDSPGSNAGQWVDKNPVGGVAGTQFVATFQNETQEELVNLVLAAGIALNKGTNTQVRDALKRLFGGFVTTVVFGDSPKALTRDNAGLVLIDAAAGNVVINLPLANILPNLRYQLVRIDGSANTVTVNRAGADIIDNGLASFTLVGSRDSRHIQSDGAAKWYSFHHASLDDYGSVILATSRTRIGAFEVGGVTGYHWFRFSADDSDVAFALYRVGVKDYLIRLQRGGAERIIEDQGWKDQNTGYAGIGAGGKLSKAGVVDNAAVAADIDASKIATGIFAGARIPDLDASKIATGTFAQARIGAGAVGQAQLKTGIGNVSGSGGAILCDLPGGEHGFYPQVRQSTVETNVRIVTMISGVDTGGAAMNIDIGTSYITRIVLGRGGTTTMFAQQRYFQASPPYDLGDGEVPLFVFALVEADGRISAVYTAPDPPWANNGPTNIRPDCWIGGKPYQARCIVLPKPAPDAPAPEWDAWAESIAAHPTHELIEVTQTVKQADMPLIPHPFLGNDLSGRTVVLLDPVSPLTERLLLLHEAGESINALLHEDYLRVDNSGILRKAPPDVMACAVKWRNSL